MMVLLGGGWTDGESPVRLLAASILSLAIPFLSTTAVARTAYMCIEGMSIRHVDGPNQCSDAEEEQSYEPTPWNWSCIDYVAAPKEQRVAYVAGWWHARTNEELIRRGNLLILPPDRGSPDLLLLNACTTLMTASDERVRSLKAEPDLFTAFTYGAFGNDPRKYAHEGFMDIYSFSFVFGPAESGEGNSSSE